MPQFAKEKIMRRILITVVLTFVLSTTALAGDVPTGGFAPPPPDEPTETTSTASLPGEVPTAGVSAQPTVGDEVILNVLGTLCALVF